MPKRNIPIRSDYDDDEEYEEQQDHRMVARSRSGGAAGPMPSLSLLTGAVMSFVQRYEPCDAYDSNAEFWTLGDIRQSLVGSVPFGGEDTIPVVLKILSEQGFSATHSTSMGAVFIIRPKYDDSEGDAYSL